MTNFQLKQADMDRPTLLIDTLRSLFESCRHFDTRGYEDQRPSAEAYCELAPTIQEELDGALSLVNLILDYYEPIAERELKASREGGLFALEMPRSNATRSLVDLCYVVRIELISQRERLLTLSPDSETWNTIAICATTRRRILRSAAALEEGICRREGFISGNMLYPTELQCSLLVRHVYGRFRKAILSGSAPKADKVHTRLRVAQREITAIVDGPAYQDLRAEDRRHFCALKKQIDGWREMGAAADAEIGLKLYDDLVNFTQLLVEVNNRADLREYDSRILSEVYLELFGDSRTPAKIPEETLEKIKVLYGRDDELDHLIDYVEDSSVELWRIPLARLMASSLIGSEANMNQSGNSSGSF